MFREEIPIGYYLMKVQNLALTYTNNIPIDGKNES